MTGKVKTCESKFFEKYSPEKIQEHYKATSHDNYIKYQGYIKSNVISGKFWFAGKDKDVCEVCLENVKAGAIPLNATFPSGHMYPPAGLFCMCTVGGVTDENA